LEKTAKNIETAELKEFKNELNRLIAPVIAPPMFPLPPVKCQNPNDYPESYNSNSKKEELILEYVENFKKQFQYIYPDRRPLFLTPLNECGVEKFSCTTIRPTTLQFSEVYDWEKCSRFVSEYLQFEALPNSTDYVIKTLYFIEFNLFLLFVATGTLVTNKSIEGSKRK
jgi:hypothetical protein